LLATFVIFLREGIEASMIVAILLAYLDRIGKRQHFRDVFIGVGLAVILAAGGGVAAYYFIGSYDGSNVQTIFETITFVVAATILTYMTFWMLRNARSISADLQHRAERAMSKGERLGLGLLSFQAVGREGLETAVFTLAIVFAAQRQGARGFAGSPQGELVGAVLGLTVALCLAYAMYHLGKRINLGRFFTCLGAMLMLFAAGLVADTVENLQQLGWVTIGDQVLWNTSHQLSEASSIGDVFHSLFGYADRPTVLQAVCYVSYLVVALGAFLIMSRRRRSGRKPQATASAASSTPGLDGSEPEAATASVPAASRLSGGSLVAPPRG
jgi:high-affinity iron transporter